MDTMKHRRVLRCIHYAVWMSKFHQGHHHIPESSQKTVMHQLMKLPDKVESNYINSRDYDPVPKYIALDTSMVEAKHLMTLITCE